MNRRLRNRLAQGITLVLTVLAIALLARYAMSVDWPAVGDAMSAYRGPALVWCGALAATSYLLYCGYELAARRYTKHDLPKGKVMLVGFTSYALGFNLGALLGGGGARLRLYSRAGLRVGTISRIVTFVFATNWLGYGVLAGGLLVSGLAPLPGGMTATVGLVVGVAMLATVASYLLACVRWHHRTWHLRGHAFEFPSPRLALLQLCLSVPNWLAIAAILFVLLRHQVDYPTLLGVLLLGAVAAAITHIPAGLGALEVVFLTLLGDRLPQAELLAALLAYRAIYYLAPLALAVATYFAFTLGTRGGWHRSRPYASGIE